MTIFLTGSPCRKGEDHFTRENGFQDRLEGAVAEVLGRRGQTLPAILLVSAAPDDRDYNRDVFESMRLCIERSGIVYRKITMLRRENSPEASALIAESELVFLCGGHVPTQNAFFHDIDLKGLLQGYDGVLVGCSAGSMNCADFVYSHPELPGESVDPEYCRWLRGLGLTDINLVPHWEDISDAWLDGRRLVEDIIVPDSMMRHFVAIPDGAYVEIYESRNDMPVLHGESYIIKNGTITKTNSNIYTFMNAVFISPHFPQTYSHFCAMLHQNGVNVFGIGDAPYHELNQELRDALTEYYRVDNMENYDEVYRAVAFLTFKHGKMDWLESNNEYWLEQNARLRTDFNICTGLKNDRIVDIKEKSAMKKFYHAGKVPTARQIRAVEGLEAVRAFAVETGYPIIAKPDNGVGAEGTYKMNSEADLAAFFAANPSNYGAFVVEEFITGSIVSYDAVVDSHCEPIFESMGYFPVPIMEIVKRQEDINYWVEKEIDPKLQEVGRRTVKAFGVPSRFVHFEFFKLDSDRRGLGKKGDYVGLEVNMRPAGGYTPDMMDYAHSTDVYKIWADMVAFDENRTPQGEQYFCAYAGRRDCHTYTHSHNDVMTRYGSAICFAERVPAALSSALCDFAYLARFTTREEMKEYFEYIGA